VSEVLRVFSFGGGVQSTAALVLQAQGKINFPTFLFANVGSDSENPATIEYVERYSKPYAEAHGIELIELQRANKDGKLLTILDAIERDDKSIPIPLRGMNGAPVFKRNCTVDYKIRVIAKWHKAHGATADNSSVTGLGISYDELERMRTRRDDIKHEILEYPLVDLRLTRRDCIKIIQESGLPVPPKSSCYFCPFHSPNEWKRMRQQEPKLFTQSVEIERAMNVKLERIGHKRKAWLTRFAKPLDEAIGDQLMFPEDLEDDNCESGYCMT